MTKPMVDNLKTHHFSRIFVIVLVVFMTVGILLYWQNDITSTGLAFWALGLVIVGSIFVLGVRVAQKDGFIDGFRNGRDGGRRTGNKT